MNMNLFYLHRNITRFHFARLVGVSNETMLDYESGRTISYKTRVRIENAIDVFRAFNIIYSDDNVRNAKLDRCFEKEFKERINKLMEF